MKKLVYITLIALIFTACGVYTTDLNRLTTGMSKAQVEAMMGRPDRVLSVKDTRDGYQEVLQYRTSRGEVYALEFWNDYLTGYEYLYDDAPYIPAPAPPMYMPDYGRPIIIIDDRPGRPSRPVRPGGNTSRPSGGRTSSGGRYESSGNSSSGGNSGRTSSSGSTSGRTSSGESSSGRTSSSSSTSGRTSSSDSYSGRTSSNSSSSGRTSSSESTSGRTSTSESSSGRTSSGSTGRTSGR